MSLIILKNMNLKVNLYMAKWKGQILLGRFVFFDSPCNIGISVWYFYKVIKDMKTNARKIC